MRNSSVAYEAEKRRFLNESVRRRLKCRRWVFFNGPLRRRAVV